MTTTTTGSPHVGEADLDTYLDEFLAAHDPSTMSDVEFRGARYDAGLAWVHFPVGFGGLGLPPRLTRVIDRRCREAGAAAQDPATFFSALAGPTIVTHAEDEQKTRFLHPMFTGEEKWCQLFSEPGAGSDFAGLGTRAVRDGDEWIVNGQKVWNTLAHLADWGMLVTRTNPDMPKHRGMTYFAVDMHSPGVEVRPLRQITGEAEFNEVYLTDARIPDDQRIGAEGDGWRVALTTLMNERVSIGASDVGRTQKAPAAADAVALWQAQPEGERDPVRRDQLMSLWSRAEVLRLTNVRAGQEAKVGNPGPSGSISKLASAELNKAVYEFCIDLMGAEALVDYDYTFRRPEQLEVTGAGHGPRYAFMRTRANSIEGGTSEIMRNILGEQVLGLPGEPRIDKDQPWISVPRS